MMLHFPNTVLPGPLYGILDDKGNILGYVAAETAHEALGEATKEIGAKARAAIIKSQLDKEAQDYASRNSTSPGSTISAQHASARALTRAIDSPSLTTGIPTTRHTSRGVWGNANHGARG